MTQDLSTELKIKEAAKRVFMAKGFDGCSTREIAKEAGMNVALVNYYFRSKGQLFQLIFRAALEDFMLSMVDVFSTDLSLESKMRIFIEREYDFLTKHPEMPGFIIGEMSRADGCGAGNMYWMKDKIAETGIFNDIQKAQEAGEIRKMDLLSIALILMSNCHFPFLGKPFVQNALHVSDEHYEQQLVLHKQYVTEMMINYLFINK
ncbi:MAG: TetR family transcriptional regulator [Fluviicola sp.]|nr:TetR family transcriptional regulator [Fluviicola sp.]